MCKKWQLSGPEQSATASYGRALETFVEVMQESAGEGLPESRLTNVVYHAIDAEAEAALRDRSELAAGVHAAVIVAEA